MDKEIFILLQDIGLTKQEANSYISLYELKEAKAGDIAKKSGIATANLYPVLASLIKKGLISYKIKNNTRIFYPASPESFNELVELKQKKLDEQKEKVKIAISKIKQVGKEIETISNYKYFEGLAGIKSLWNELADYMAKFDESKVLKIYGSPKEWSENLRGFYNEFHEKRLKLGQSYKLIVDTKFKEEMSALRREQKTEVRSLDLKNEASFGVFENIFFTLYQTGKTPVGFLVLDSKIAKSFEQVFDQLWETAK